MTLQRTRRSTRTGGRPQAAASVYIAIGEPTRRRLLDSLGHGERNVTDLARPFRMTRAAVSQHLRILLDSGLVTARKVGRERRYRLRAAPLREVYDWVEHYKKFWTEKLTALSKYLNREAQKLRKQENTEAKEPAD